MQPADDEQVLTHDECAEASVLPLLDAFDAFEHALRRVGPDAVLEAAVERADIIVGDAVADDEDDDLLATLRAFVDALHDLPPLVPRSLNRAHFRPPLQGRNG